MCATKVEHHVHTTGPGETVITGGQEVTPLERVILDLVALVADNIASFNSVEPPHERNNPRVERAIARQDTLLSVYQTLSGQSAWTGLTTAVAVLAEDPTPAQIRPLRQWLDNQHGRVAGEPAPSPCRHTLTSAEDHYIDLLRSGLADRDRSAWAPAVASEGDEQHEAREFLLGLLRRYSRHRSDALEVGARWATVSDAKGEELRVLSAVDEPGITEAHRALAPFLGETFTLEQP
jgi:hypothetical protein